MKNILLCFCLAGSSLAGTRAHGDVGRSHTTMSKTEAQSRQYFVQGQTLISQGDFKGAYEAFESGYRISKRPAFLFNMGESARQFKDFLKARNAYLRYLDMDPKGNYVEKANDRLRELDKEHTHSSIPLPTTAHANLDKQVAADPRVPPVETTDGVQANLFSASQMQIQPSNDLFSVPKNDRPVWKKWPFWAVAGTAIVATTALVYAKNSNEDHGVIVDWRN